MSTKHRKIIDCYTKAYHQLMWHHYYAQETLLHNHPMCLLPNPIHKMSQVQLAGMVVHVFRQSIVELSLTIICGRLELNTNSLKLWARYQMCMHYSHRESWQCTWVQLLFSGMHIDHIIRHLLVPLIKILPRQLKWTLSLETCKV